MWLRVRWREFAGVPFLHRLNLALATFMLVSFLGHTVLDLQQGVERRVGRILSGPYHEKRLQQLMRNGAVSTEQVIDWARLREGRLQSNAIYMLRFSDQTQARQALQEIGRRGPANLAELARQSLAWKASK